MSPMAAMRKSPGGIGGKFSSLDTPEEQDTAKQDNARMLEASKLLLRAIDKQDPKLVAQAISTLVSCCSDDGDGADAESESEDLGD